MIGNHSRYYAVVSWERVIRLQAFVSEEEEEEFMYQRRIVFRSKKYAKVQIITSTAERPTLHIVTI